MKSASVSSPTPMTGLRAYFVRHLQAFFFALGELTRNPVSSLLTAAVIGISLALPMGLQVMLKNAQQVIHGWEGAAQISLFIKNDVPEEKITRFANHIRQLGEIESVERISRQQALKEFSENSGYGDALKALDENPLPNVLVVYPKAEYSQPDTVTALTSTFRKHPVVEMAQLDMQWVKRLYTLMEIASRGIYLLAGLLAVAVILIIGNTIRLSIENRRDEIVITKLIGATDAFIRRPFLYDGMWLGLVGALLALVLVSLSLWLLSEPVSRLSALYNSNFILHFLSLKEIMVLLGVGLGLGLTGSWTAVGRHLRDIEPA